MFKISHNKNLLFKSFDNNVSNYKYLVFFQVIFPPEYNIVSNHD